MAASSTKQRRQEEYMFHISGPTHLTSVNWTCPDHRRSVAACLVRGASALEHDRQNGRQDAPAWWKKFHFELKRELRYPKSSVIIGAIYEFNPPAPIQNAPKTVIAFRGTLVMNWQDIKLDLKVLNNHLERTPHCEEAMRAVEEMVSANVDGQNLWLAGHSLGSAIAMLAGKNMAKRGINLETFLFNPPYPSILLIEWIKSKTVQQFIQILTSIVTDGVALAKEGRRENSRQHFAQISSWVPHLFVNSHDIICSGYIGYFEQRENMEDIGLGFIERLATRTSARALACRSDSEPFDLLPSANLVVTPLDRNRTEGRDLLKRAKLAHHICRLFKRTKQAHRICQWWSQDLSLQSKEHHYG